jgi:hypothetical protein
LCGRLEHAMLLQSLLLGLVLGHTSLLSVV